jgi:hypothetical protein
VSNLLWTERKKQASVPERNETEVEGGRLQQPTRDFTLDARDADRLLAGQHQRGCDVYEHPEHRAVASATVAVGSEHSYNPML